MARVNVGLIALAIVALSVSTAERLFSRGASEAHGPLSDVQHVLTSFRLPAVPNAPTPGGTAAKNLGADAKSVAGVPGAGSYHSQTSAARALYASAGPDLISTCPSCSAFLEKLVAAAEGAVQPHDSVGRTHASVEEVNAANRALCASSFGGSAPLEQVEACEDVHDMYGLDHVKVLVNHAPSLLCEPLRSCGRFSVADDVAAGGIASAATGEGGDLLLQTGVPGALCSLGINSAAMEQQQMLQGQRMREQEMREMDSLLTSQIQQKLLAAQERNKNLRDSLKHIEREAYRNQPGHCDCCDGCTAGGAPAAAGAGHH